MFAVRLAADADEDAFRAAARQALAIGAAPHALCFVSPDAPTLFPPLPEAIAAAAAVSVPRTYHDLLHAAICHRESDRFALLYEVLWRLVRGERHLLDNLADPTVARLNDYARAVRRDTHKMHAFLRFRRQVVDGAVLFVAWFEPQHFILRRAATFFVDRFANMDWVIATPIGTATWRDRTLVFGPPAQSAPPVDDVVLDEFWTTYYRTTFNPARLRLKAMQKEMPRHYWVNMPETAAIPEMIATAGQRVDEMKSIEPDIPPLFAAKVGVRRTVVVKAEPGAPPPAALDDLRDEVAACRRCPLWAPATQSVFGEGPAEARLMFVGEQPGDQEDLAGRPFVGPAGQLFDRALLASGLDRQIVYVTNAVKHFKYEPRGKRRIHKKPNAGEVSACRWWMERELATVRPALVVALGATAANALAQRTVSVMRERGPIMFGALPGFVTVHPSFLLRLPDADKKAQEYERFVEDLRRIKAMAA